jgi:hypothetical protein
MNQRFNPTFAYAQPLEPRRLLAGDVTAVLAGHDLIIRGSRADNAIEISQPEPGVIEVAGADDTTVNGEESVEFQGVEALLIRTHNGGEDSVTVIGPLELSDDLRAHLGNDELLIDGTAGRVRIGSDLNVRARSASAVTLRNDVLVADDVTISTFGEVVAFGARATLFDYTAAEFNDSTNVDNPYFPLVPGTTYEYRVEEEDDETDEITRERVVVEVLSETRTVAGVEVRIVRDRVFELEDAEDQEGLLVEDTFDWYAQDDDGNVWYFGEDTTSFEHDDEGNVVSTSKEGSFEVGVDDARAGIVMLADPTVGQRYYQEFLPREAIDYGEVLATDEALEVPVGTFDDVLRTEDVNPLEPDGLENKFYAPGLGMIAEDVLDIEDNEVTGTVRLVSVTLDGQPVTQVVAPDGFDGANPAEGETRNGVEFNDKAHIDAGGEVLLNGLDADRLRIDSNSQVLLIDSTLGGSSSIAAEEDVSLKELTAFRPLKISGPLDLFVFRSDLERVKVRLGGGDDELIIEDSMLELLDADGGAGDNTLEEIGENAIDARRIRRFTDA